ncbi:Hypothetical protein HVR_LOCUS931 [uncultured virus]|nr:Hypothetical protein HVR_LOCUS931 [uncultured virus]
MNRSVIPIELVARAPTAQMTFSNFRPPTPRFSRIPIITSNFTGTSTITPLNQIPVMPTITPTMTLDTSQIPEFTIIAQTNTTPLIQIPKVFVKHSTKSN